VWGECERYQDDPNCSPLMATAARLAELADPLGVVRATLADITERTALSPAEQWVTLGHLVGLGLVDAFVPPPPPDAGELALQLRARRRGRR
jgi:hypothetical protein